MVKCCWTKDALVHGKCDYAAEFTYHLHPSFCSPLFLLHCVQVIPQLYHYLLYDVSITVLHDIFTMPFVNAAARNAVARKRGRTDSRTASPLPVPKMARIDAILYDGPGSGQSSQSNSTGQISAISSSTGRLSVTNVKGKLRRSVVSLKTLLGFGNKYDAGRLMVSQTASRAAFERENHSDDTTVVKPLHLGLVGDTNTVNAETDVELSGSQSAPLTPTPTMLVDERGNPYAIDPNAQAFYDLRKSHSTPKLRRRLSARMQQAFANAPSTVVRRAELQTRPSVQQLQHFGVITNGEQFSSNPSTLTSGSGSAPVNRNWSTPPTSEGLAVSPASIIARQEARRLPEAESGVVVRNNWCGQVELQDALGSCSSRRLSIVTVEAAATAKIFFETHFNALLNGYQPRSLRRRELELKLRSLQLEPEVQQRSREAWRAQESDLLRRERMLKSRPLDPAGIKGVSVGGYEVVKVLGKGSFGVVRLVKERATACPSTADRCITALMTLERPSRSDLAILRASAKEKLVPLASRRRDPNRGKKEVYAMKVIRKAAMIRNGQEGHLRAERDFLVAAEGSRWIIQLLAAFQDTKFLYLVMDYCIGGDFLGLLIRKSTLSEEVTKWYIAEMVLCVEEAHRMRWIHRDIKPDNFLIGADGHLKISDFGLAFDGEWAHDQRYYHKHRHSLVEKLGLSVVGDKDDIQEAEDAKTSRQIAKLFPRTQVRSKSDSRDEPAIGEPVLDWRNRAQRRRLAKSVVGTSQYMAPEVIRGEHYDGRCDWWSVGIIMYECLYGYTPFACEDRHNTKLKILRHKETLAFPEVPLTLQPSWAALDLMSCILVEKEKRLCTRQYELNDFTMKLLNGWPQKVAIRDKSNRNYAGYFVYPDDGEDIKRHPFFNNINWNTMHLRRPPFVPRVRDWEDTKYFDENSVSDIQSDTSDDYDESQATRAEASGVGNGHRTPARSSKASQHQHEDQSITPSSTSKETSATVGKPMANPLKNADNEQTRHDDVPAPINAPPYTIHAVQWQQENLDDTPISDPKPPKKEKKKPRDKILRDAACAKTALDIRKVGAFLGYGYHRSRTPDEIIDTVLVESAKKKTRDRPVNGTERTMHGGQEYERIDRGEYRGITYSIPQNR